MCVLPKLLNDRLNIPHQKCLEQECHTWDFFSYFGIFAYTE